MKCLLTEPGGYIVERDLSRVPIVGEIVRVRHICTNGETVSLLFKAVAHTPDDERGMVAILGVIRT